MNFFLNGNLNSLGNDVMDFLFLIYEAPDSNRILENLALRSEKDAHSVMQQ